MVDLIFKLYTMIYIMLYCWNQKTFISILIFKSHNTIKKPFNPNFYFQTHGLKIFATSCFICFHKIYKVDDENQMLTAKLKEGSKTLIFSARFCFARTL